MYLLAVIVFLTYHLRRLVRTVLAKESSLFSDNYKTATMKYMCLSTLTEHLFSGLFKQHVSECLS
jgi:hypothetical protein